MEAGNMSNWFDNQINHLILCTPVAMETFSGIRKPKTDQLIF